ncbi:MAG: Dihydrofolate reductase [uncultured Gemmatimonadetes bacterium]|uniref:Dihydrofolate reductase n=1 Tax=uncultured Gemmatimonadota bacterium TaxID=203437 RepID=A0A6J4KTD5_9BACT|nr:MAG: Dihydrofolate reductase [uncultured Gemmatimonadota bacterium]
MRPVRYNVAASLDGYIAGPRGEFDWIPMDPTVDFASIFGKIDTVLLGRRSYETALEGGTPPWPPGARVYVFSRTLRPEDHPGLTVVSGDAGRVVSALRAEPGGGEIWLFGGGDLFGSLLAEGQVDTVEVTLVPILLGGGVPLLPPGAPRTTLALTGTHTYPSGMVSLSYTVQQPSAAPNDAP